MWFDSTYTFLGGLGIFFFGMKNLSESLQALSGNLIRKIIHTLTSNRLIAVAVGVFVTSLVQSSSVTTVMIVGLVNAGLMQLTQAIGVIFGANIGTTITGWIIAVKVGKYGLLFVGAGAFPYLFSKNDRIKQSGLAVIALGFVFMGLEFMSSALKPLSQSESFMALMRYFSAGTYPTLLACIAIGAALTLIVQSSSAMLGVTIALASTGAITYQSAIALVLGENIGTTITALLAGIGANTNARRAAVAHALFNVLAVLLLTPFFWKYIEFVDWVVAGVPDELSADGSKPLIAAHIAAGHTFFNVTAVFLFVPFLNQLAALVTWLVPAPLKKEIPHLKHLNGITESEAPGISLAMAEKELANLAEVAERAFKLCREYLLAAEPSTKMKEKVFYYETVTDAIQREITVFLCKTHESRMTYDQSALSYALIRAADELESVGDYCASLVRYRDRLTSAGESLSEEAFADLNRYLDAVLEDYQGIVETLQAHRPFNLKKYSETHQYLTEMANQIWNNHRHRVEKNRCSPVSGMLFSDIIVALRKLKGHSLNIVEALDAPREGGGGPLVSVDPEDRKVPVPTSGIVRSEATAFLKADPTPEGSHS